MSAPQLPPELRAKILGNLGPAPTRSTWQWRSAIVLALGLVASLVLFFAVGGVRLGQRPAVYVAALGAALGALVVASAPGLLRRGRSSVGRPSRVLIGLSFAVPLLALGLVAAAAVLWPETRLITDDRSDFRCFGWAFLLGAAPFATFVWLKRRVVLVHAHVEAAAAGTLAGAVGACLITLRCDCSELSHLFLGHVAPVLVFGAVSALLVGRWLSRAPLRA